jgi:epsilon-lactone hydrolase
MRTSATYIRPMVNDDGSLPIGGFTLPPSEAWSPEALQVYKKRFTNNPVAAERRAPGEGGDAQERWLTSQRAYRDGMEFLHRRLVEKMRPAHPVDVEETTVGGVRVQIVTPQSGVRDPSRVLVNLHGGAFVGGAEHCGLVESIPVATTGGYRIVVVDYRQGWEHSFPAASEDVAAVYEALLGDHDAESIGIFGYSAGAALTMQAAAWMVQHGTPVPGAIALCSGSSGFAGDSSYLALAAMGDAVPVRAAGGIASATEFGYLAGVDPNDPLVDPGGHPDVLARFPRSMVLTGTRSFDLSGAVRTHRALLAAGVPADLHVWEGMWHCFPYHHAMPESQDAYRTIASFFDRALAPAG